MSVYGNFAKGIVSESSGINSLEEYAEINSIILGSMLNSYINESDDEDDELGIDDIVEEGANLNYRAAFKSGRKKYNEAFKKAKKSYRSGNYSDAKKYIKEADKALGDIEKVLKEVDSTIGSAIFGYFAASLLNMAEMIVPFALMATGMGVQAHGINTFFSAGSKADINSAINALDSGLKTTGLGGAISTAGSVMTFIKMIIITIKMLIQLSDDIKDPKTSSPQALNLYRNKLLTYVKDMRKHLNKLADKIGK